MIRFAKTVTAVPAADEIGMPGKGRAVIDPVPSNFEAGRLVPIVSRFRRAVPAGTAVYVVEIGDEWHIIAADCGELD